MRMGRKFRAIQWAGGELRRLRCGVLVFSLAVMSAYCPSAFAQQDESRLEDVEPDLSGDVVPAPGQASAASPPETDTSGADPGAVFRAYRHFADTSFRQRMLSSAGGVVAGGTVIGLGAAVLNQGDPWRDFFFISGGLTAGLSALGFLMPSAAERTAREYGVYSEMPITRERARALDQEWAAQANQARSMRFVGSGISFVLGATAIGFGAAIAGGAFDLASPDRTAFTAILLSAGGGFVMSGVAGLVIKTPVESAFEAYRTTAHGGRTSTGLTDLRVGFAPMDGGGFVSARTHF